MAARVASNGLGCIGRSVLTGYAFDVAGIVRMTARKTSDAEVGEIFRPKATRGSRQDGLGPVDEPLVSSGIAACPRAPAASAVGLTPTTVADDPAAVTVGYDNERGRVEPMVRRALAIPDEAASSR
ncbi:hypothetical protein [Streptomyces gilvosporeus]|uniref:Uncharacterized protein n=1 Tax=Streptomyces gilvosporeus TaxID=553510 RepID=A0A1V0TKC7_9ACTN|nr:hypothetical protein [Streptomyces gilvosporeus]ARF53353.1 hypothetical protein B1H19_03505 [Streptomyces gilvosporeus]